MDFYTLTEASFCKTASNRLHSSSKFGVNTPCPRLVRISSASRNVCHLSILHGLIRSQDTGGIRDLAVRLHVSERTVRNYIDELKLTFEVSIDQSICHSTCNSVLSSM